MRNALYPNATSLHNKIHKLRARAAVSSLGALVIFETWARRGIIDAKLVITEYELLGKTVVTVKRWWCCHNDQ